MSKNPEKERLLEDTAHKTFWKEWGPYLSEREWGTVREDYSAEGNPWAYLPHDHARSKAYRWGEDGIAGISDIHQKLCFALALWNHQDPILKERLYGVNGMEGNHGEDVKELYYYLDNTPTHSYMKYLYKYPQRAYPYEELVKTNQERSKEESEYELLETGILDDDRYFDVAVEYIKKAPEDIYIRITAVNRGDKAAPLLILPTLWYRNTWDIGQEEKPEIQIKNPKNNPTLQATHEDLGTYYLSGQDADEALATENETNTKRLYQQDNATPYVKDAFHEVFIAGNRQLLEGNESGTKCCMVYDLKIDPSETAEIWLRLTSRPEDSLNIEEAKEVRRKRIREADDFYEPLYPETAGNAEKQIQRQAFANLLWNKQFYHYVVEQWLEGDPGQPKPPEERKNRRNSDWKHLFNRDVLNMPDKWEYPWYASWDLAFHCIPLALIDAEEAKKQLLLFLREWYMHPSGQIPAYEWSLGEANPPVHAWACMRVFEIEREQSGEGDREFLKRAFHKLLLNFTWWVNRKDRHGHNIFQGGFLGLDNIGLFDRSKPLPIEGHMEQADGTSWMAMYALNMMKISLELAAEDPAYEDLASKFFEHFIRISEAFNGLVSGEEVKLWDEEDGFFYDAIHYDDGHVENIKIRSFVGLIPLFAVAVFDDEILNKYPGFAKRFRWFQENRASLDKCLLVEEVEGKENMMLSLVNRERLQRILTKMLDEKEFLSIGGIRSLSRYHKEHPFTMELGDDQYSVAYEPAESDEAIFGGNSNWRGPIWMPLNYLLCDALLQYDRYFGKQVQMEFPTGSDHQLTLSEISVQLSQRLLNLMLPDEDGNRPIHGDEKRYAQDPNFKDLVLFYEYFHGEDCRGLGASHQAGWTALVAKFIQDCYQ